MFSKIVRSLVGVLLLAGTADLFAEVTLPAIFSDHMVLQRSGATPVWGWAAPGERVTVMLAGAEAVTTADADGNWKLELGLAKLPAGPHRMKVQGTNTLEVSDVLLGEVWLASGQSNMERQLSRIGATQDIAQSSDDAVRFFSVRFNPQNTPAKDVRGTWQVSSPANSPSFSAVAWYFAKRLREERKLPVGIISSSVGGTPVEAWTSQAALESDPVAAPEVKADLKQSEAFPVTKATWAADIASWTRQNDRVDRPTPAADLKTFTTAKADVSSGWQDIKLPGKVPGEGIIWVRRDIDLRPEDAGKDLKIDINEIVGLDTVYWDGVEIGGRTFDTFPGQGAGRRDVRCGYRISADQATAGTHTVAIRIYNPWGGIALNGGYFSVGSRYLGGTWQTCAEVTFPALSSTAKAAMPARLEAPLRPYNLPASLYNGMIAPLVPYRLRGVIWYQGEHNAGNPERYRTTFPLLIKNWRQLWSAPDMSFYWCQLPNYQDKTSDPDQRSGWVGLRAAQTETLSLPNTGQAVIIDVGEAGDIHPSNKRVPGERLAAIALALNYGEDIEYSGPVCTGSRVIGDKVHLSFQHTGGGLKAAELSSEYLYKTIPSVVTKPLLRNSPGSQLEGFALRDEAGRWHWADASIVDGEVVVTSPQVKHPSAVRYACSANPTINLYNGAGFPAGPFELTF